VTEEVWSWWREGSVHRAAWPDPSELAVADAADLEVYAVGADVLSAVRKEKALAKVSLKVPVTSLVVYDTSDRVRRIGLVERDLRQSGNIRDMRTAVADAFSVEVTLGAPEPA
jgi:valyl-tRNA synthetase